MRAICLLLLLLLRLVFQNNWLSVVQEHAGMVTDYSGRDEKGSLSEMRNFVGGKNI